jgi:hypothetical protein
VASKCSDGPQKEWEVMDVHGFHQLEQMLPQRRLSPHQNQANHGFCNRLQNIGAARLFLGYHQIWLRREDEEKMSFITPFGTYYYL